MELFPNLRLAGLGLGSGDDGTFSSNFSGGGALDFIFNGASAQ